MKPKLYILFCFLFFFSAAAQAHQVSAVSAKASFERDGSYSVELSLDIASSTNPSLNDEISPEEAALTYLSEAVTLLYDENEIDPEFSALKPVENEDMPDQATVTRLYTETTGKVPEGAEQFFLRVSPDVEVAVVMVVFKDGQVGRRAHVLYPGETSNPIDLSFVGEEVIQADPFEADAPPPGFWEAVRSGVGWMFSHGAAPTLILLAVLLTAQTFWQACWRAAVVLLGFWLVVWIPGFEVGPAKITANWRAFLGFVVGTGLTADVLTGVAILALGTFWKESWYAKFVTAPVGLIAAGAALFWILSAFLPGA